MNLDNIPKATRTIRTIQKIDCPLLPREGERLIFGKISLNERVKVPLPRKMGAKIVPAKNPKRWA
jgi:hypothetical protein